MKLISRDEILTIQFGIKFSSFTSFIFFCFFFPLPFSFFSFFSFLFFSPGKFCTSLLCISSRCFAPLFLQRLTRCSPMGAAEQDFQGVNQMPASTRCKMPCLEVCVFVWRWECYHRTNMEKVGRKGAPRWKGRRGLYPLFSPYSPPCSFSPSEQFSSRAKGQEITKCLFHPLLAFHSPLMLYLHRRSFQFTLSALLQTPNESVCFPALLHVYI